MVLVTESRCSGIEVIHHGAIAISTEQGTIFSGDPAGSSSPLRSTAKPFMLAGLLDTVLSNETFSSEELALMSSSHNGEPQHLSALIALLARYSLLLEDLQCGIHYPYKTWSIPSNGGNNCSGKHAAMLIAGKLSGHTLHDYTSAKHPIQKMVLEKVEEYLGETPINIGIDGCSLPTASYPLATLASAYRRHASDQISAGCTRVRRAHLKAPFYVAGTDRLETYLIGHYGLTAKSGSEGVWAIGVPGKNIGVAVKVVSGSEPAAQATLLRFLNDRKIIDIASDPYLQPYFDHDLHSWAGIKSGEFRVCFQESRIA